MAVFTMTLQGASPTTIDATDVIELAGAGGFGSKITVGAYNDTTHVRSSGNANDSSGNTPKNSKYVDSTHVDIGGGSVLLNSISTANCPLKINFSDAASVATSAAKFYFYDGTTPANAVTGVTCYAAEQGNSTWVAAEGSAAGVSLADQSAATSHDFYLMLSASPDSVGLKTAIGVRVELTYS